MSDKNSPNSVLKYSGLAVQMIGVLLLFTWLGRQLDSYLELKTPWFTLSFILMGLFGVMYKLIKDFSKK